MITAENCNRIFNKCIEQYHVLDTVDQAIENPYPEAEIDHLLYHKCWIDTVQWHFEDLIRDPKIDPEKGMALKRLIDASNQHRTDKVEQIDDWFLSQFTGVKTETDARINSESPAWVVDRLSILALKIYHMKEEAERTDASDSHRDACANKLLVLLEQQTDLCTAIDELLEDFNKGDKYMKVYKQMKMYNDDELNPVLRKTPKG